MVHSMPNRHKGEKKTKRWVISALNALQVNADNILRFFFLFLESNVGSELTPAQPELLFSEL